MEAAPSTAGRVMSSSCQQGFETAHAQLVVSGRGLSHLLFLDCSRKCRDSQQEKYRRVARYLNAPGVIAQSKPTLERTEVKANDSTTGKLWMGRLLRW